MPDTARSKRKTIRLLTVGNSFAVNATRYLGDLAKVAGHRLVLGTCNIGGCSLERHWTKAEAFEKNPRAARRDKVQYADNMSLKERLRSGKWDVVTIQQYSRIAHDPAGYRPYARNLRDYILTHAPEAEVVFIETWAYRCDTPDMPPSPDAASRMMTRKEMARRVRRAYALLGRELGIRGIPVGDAFDLVESDPKWRFRPDRSHDLAKARPGELPDQARSLHRGYFWRTDKEGKDIRLMDGRHASDAGQYLGACVLFEFLFGEDVRRNPFTPVELGVAFARRLRRAAHDAVAARRSPPTRSR